MADPSLDFTHRLWILVGLPGSGKSTWARALLESAVPDVPQWQIVSTDEIRAQRYGDAGIQGNWVEVWGEVQRQFRDRFIAGDSVIYDATNAQRRSRRFVIQTARSTGFTRIGLCWLRVPVEVCLARNQQRSRRVPDEVILRMARQLAGAPPSLAEDIDLLLSVLP